MNPNPETHPKMQTFEPCRAMWVLVTPEMAARWLEGNQNNRNVRKSVVAKYAKDMAAGMWTPSNDAICVGTDGRLLNGQHRLMGVVASGVSVGMFVITGMPAEAFDNMDRGAGRKHSDILRAKGYGGMSITLSATLTRAVGYARGVGAGHGDRAGVWMTHHADITDSDRSGYLMLHGGIVRSVETFGTKAGMKAAGNCPASILALAHHLIEAAAGWEAADMFMHQLITQDREPAVGTIRSAIRAIAGTGSKHGNDDRKLAIILAAWNAWAAGRELVQMKVHADFRTRPIVIAKRVTR